MLDSLELLSRRLAELDALPLRYQAVPSNHTIADNYDAYAEITHFATTMSAYTRVLMNCEVGSRATIEPGDADALTANARLLRAIAQHDAHLVTGPLLAKRQHWTRTGRHAVSADTVPPPPRRIAFITPSSTLGQKPEVKPFRFGLYTSTATSVGRSMWRALLGPHGSSLYPLPWCTWELEMKGRPIVAEIESAERWVEFVSTYPQIQDGFIYPDWPRVAQEFDAIHLTLPLIAAAQGFYFQTPDGIIPPAFWDVETTLWLRWCFSGAHLVETTPRDVHSRDAF
jgi:hypothetical protein